MGRHSVFNKRKLVSFDPETRISKCLLCDKPLKGNLLGNIKRHYVRIHKYSFEGVTNSNQNAAENKTLMNKNFDSKEQKSTTTVQSIANIKPINNSSHSYASSSSFVTNSTIFKLNKHEFIKCCLGLVSNSIPFCLFDDKHFKRIIEPYENAYNLSLDSKKIEELSFSYSNRIKEHISILLDKKLLNLKVDIATKHDTSIAVINIQYMKDFRIQTHTIGIIELKKRCAGESLKYEIIKCLSDYNIIMEQLLTTATDNVAYCLNATEQLLAESTDVQDYNEGIIENESFIKIYMKIKEILPHGSFAPHAPKQVAQELFNIFKNQIESCRIVVKHLRAQMQESLNLRKPTVECPSRWYSTYYMMESLYFLKDFISSNEIEMQIDWFFVEKFLEALKPLVECSRQLHNDQYIVGDFFRDWLLCETKLENIMENTCATQLYEFMQLEKMKFMENDWFLAALYFDPRFNFMGSPFFDDQKRNTAVLYILELNISLTSLNGNTVLSEHEENDFQLKTTNSPTPMPNNVTQDDPYGALELKLSMSTTLPTQNTEKISRKIENLAYGQRMPFSTNVLDYWKIIAFKEIDLAQLAQIVLAIPANQFSIGRAVNALETVLANQSSNTSSETLKHISFIKLNADILDIV